MGDGCDIEPWAGVGVVEKGGVGFGGRRSGGGGGGGCWVRDLLTITQASGSRKGLVTGW